MERRGFKTYQLRPIMKFKRKQIRNPGKQHKERDSPEVWDPPPNNMFKVNFDGASKGNLSPTGFRGAIRNAEG